MDSGGGTRVRPLLLLHLGAPGLRGEDAPLSDNDDVPSGELLLKLPDQLGLDLVDHLELLVRDDDHDGLLGANIDLLGGGDVNLAKIGLQLSRGVPEVEKCLGHGGLKGSRLLIAVLANLVQGSEHVLRAFP